MSAGSDDSVPSDVERLRQHLIRLASEADVGLTDRYATSPPRPKRLSLWRRFRVWLGLHLRRLRIRRPPPPEPWLPGLKHAEQSEVAKPLVIWALGTQPEILREACVGFQQHDLSSLALVPVLVTDVADFAFFSRLGWLVEYVPALSCSAGNYARRKARYLAWRYRDAQALPIEAGLRTDLRIDELLARKLENGGASGTVCP